MYEVIVDGEGDDALRGYDGTTRWLLTVLLAVLLCVVLLVFLDGIGDEVADDKLGVECSGLLQRSLRD